MIIPILIALHCTTWTSYKDTQAVCLVNNAWKQIGNLTATYGPCTDTFPRVWNATQLFTSTDTKTLYAQIETCMNDPEGEFWLKKWDGKIWHDLGIIAKDAEPDPPYAQFGIHAAYVPFLTTPLTAVINGYRSISFRTYENDQWVNTPIEPSPPVGQPVRHPEIYPFANRAFILWGEGGDFGLRLFEITEGNVEAFPVPIPQPELAKALYTDMTMWNGKPVVAYAYYTAPYVSWAETTDKTRIIMFDGNAWVTLSDSIQDTWSHDGVKSHVFVRNGKLHAMYFDYSSTGRPSDAQIVRARFRVKVYDDVTKTWTRVGNESPVFMLSQKFEYLDDNGVVYFNATVRSLPYYILQTWKWDGNFVRFGPNVKVLDKQQTQPRPGRPVTYTGPVF